LGQSSRVSTLTLRQLGCQAFIRVFTCESMIGMFVDSYAIHFFMRRFVQGTIPALPDANRATSRDDKSSLLDYRMYEFYGGARLLAI